MELFHLHYALETPNANPVGKDAKYRETVTNASVLYPLVALLGALLKDDELFAVLATLQSETLPYSNFQYWFPDAATEDNLYTNHDLHGLTLSDIGLQDGPDAVLKQLSAECDQLPDFWKLSCVQQGRWPLVLVACRHYRLPIPGARECSLPNSICAPMSDNPFTSRRAGSMTLR